MSYHYRDFEVSDFMQEKLNDYIEFGTPVGGFLQAVITNNLQRAVQYADETNLRNLPAFVAYLYNHAPRDCWGSPGAYNYWMSRKELELEQGLPTTPDERETEL